MKKTLIALFALATCVQAVETQTETTHLLASTDNWTLTHDGGAYDTTPVIDTANETITHSGHWNKGVAIYTFEEAIILDAPAHAITLSYTMTPRAADNMVGALAMYADDCVIAAGVFTYGSTYSVGYSNASAALTSQEILLGNGGSADHAYVMSGGEVTSLEAITANVGVVYSHTIAWDDTENAFVLTTKKDDSVVLTQKLGETYTLNKISFVTDGSSTTSPTLSGLTLAVTAPEPATATLSLLALAGLAARRRRH